ncbi:T9SS type A sorting domain-containing protein [bacterium]|nr:T9SS type A sorting domain-containing protein [bacterium]
MIRTLTSMLCIAFCISLPSTAAFAEEWGFVVNGQAAPVIVAADSAGNKIIAAFQGGGYWLTQDGGQNWEPFNHYLSTELMLQATSVDFIDPAGEFIQVNCYFHNDWEPEYHTENGGATWSTYDLEPFWPDTLSGPGSGVWKIMQEPQGRIYYATQHGFAVSSDGGGWWQIADIERIIFTADGLFVNPNDPDNVFVFGGWTDEDPITLEPSGGIIASYDRGHTWDRVVALEDMTGVEHGNVNDLTMLPDGTLIATIYPASSQPILQFIRSTDGGLNWEWFPYQGLPGYLQAGELIAVPEVPGRLILTANNRSGVWISEDAGSTWARIENGLPDAPQYGRCLYRNPFSGHLYVALNEQGLFRSTDFGLSWTEVPGPPLGVHSVPMCTAPSGNDGFWFNSIDGNIWFASGSSTNFTRITEPSLLGSHTFLNGFALPEGLIGYTKNVTDLSTEQRTISIKWSEDGGNTWTESAETVFNSDEGFTFTQAFVENNDIRLLGGSTFQQTVYLSDDLGDTWDPIEITTGWMGHIRQHRDQYYAVDLTEGELMRSWSIGPTWFPLDFPQPDQLQYAGPPMISLSDTLYLVALDHLWAFLPDDSWEFRSDLGGHVNTWDLVTSDEDTFLVADIWPNYQSGLNVSYDMGTTWQTQELEYPWPNQSNQIVNISYDMFRQRLWIDSGVGLAYLDMAETSVGDPWVLQPAEPELLTTYPNPFNASTTIRFTLDTPQAVKLDVYDLLGRHVASLADGVRQPGRHEVTFDGTELPSGSYFLRYDSNVTTFERKLVLLK